MNMKYWSIIIYLVSCVMVSAQETRFNKEGGGYAFSNFKEIDATEVKNQYRSGTCWSYSGLSFFESELIRNGIKNPNLSEMYVVRMAYSMKAEEYVRRQGKYQFGPGGQFHDVIEVVRRYGIVPEDSYDGKPISYGRPVHAELDAMSKAVLDVVVKNPGKKLSDNWREAYEGVLDAYLGEAPEKLALDGKELTPHEYAESLGINWDDYVQLTSFSHEPFYSSFSLRIPDNWLMGKYYNVPLNELIDVLENAIENGYSIAWDADVSEHGFSFKNGVAIQPSVDWSVMTKELRDTLFKGPIEELEVTQAERQKMYDNYQTTDDHLMHITGYCQDQTGARFFLVKNSWGDDRNDCEGYFYASEPYVKAKTIAIMVHKNSIPKSIRKKLGI